MFPYTYLRFIHVLTTLGLIAAVATPWPKAVAFGVLAFIVVADSFVVWVIRHNDRQADRYREELGISTSRETGRSDR